MRIFWIILWLCILIAIDFSLKFFFHGPFQNMFESRPAPLQVTGTGSRNWEGSRWQEHCNLRACSKHFSMPWFPSWWSRQDNSANHSGSLGIQWINSHNALLMVPQEMSAAAPQRWPSCPSAALPKFMFQISARLRPLSCPPPLVDAWHLTPRAVRATSKVINLPPAPAAPSNLRTETALL